jgi:hypothetical protein
MPAHAEGNRPGGPSTSKARAARRDAAVRLDRRLEHRLTVRSADDLAPMIEHDRRAAGVEEPQRSPGPGYGHGV